MRAAVSLLVAMVLFSGASSALAQESPINELRESELPQEERICQVEIEAVQAILDEKLESLDEMQQRRLRTQLDEARAFCEAGNEVMAAVRLEAVAAMIEVTGTN